MKLFWLVMPLILIGFIGIQESFAEQASGKPIWETNSDLVCGDKLCSDIEESFAEGEPLEITSELLISHAPKLGETAELILNYKIEHFDSNTPMEIFEGLGLPVGFVMVDQDDFITPLIGERSTDGTFMKIKMITDSGYYQSKVTIKAIHEGYWSIGGGVTGDSGSSVIYLKVGKDDSLIQKTPFDESVQMNWPSKIESEKEILVEEDKINYLVRDIKNPWYTHYPDTEKPNPKMQLEKGVKPSNIVCRHSYYLIYKVSDHSPICVNQENVNKLIKRGWGTIGETSLIITTDKTQYQIGENIKISMKNQGETLLVWSGSPRFVILDQDENGIDLPITNAMPPFDSMGLLSPDAEISLIWNQTDSEFKQMIPGNYSIQASYQSPGEHSHYIGGVEEITRINFEIVE